MVSRADRLRAVLSGPALAVVGIAAWPSVAAAQAYAQPMVQSLPDAAALQLNEAVRALARDPRSLTALLAAAEASLALDDVDAASGFVQRAETIAPADGRVTASRAAILVRRQRPIEALRLFAEAEKAGALAVSHVAERGLAHDLIGDNARAQRDYSVALSAGPDPAISRRLALSQAIAGDQRASEATLLPLLQRSDLAAYRTRAFALAILGKPDEAVSIAETMLPDRLAGRMAPYLRYMPRLTRAQQAAAANLGVFPQAAQIGRDDPALAASVPPAVARTPERTADARLVPSGEPLGSPVARDGGRARLEEAAPPVALAGPAPTLAEPQPAAALGPPPIVEPQPESMSPAPTVVAVLEPDQQATQPAISLAQAEPAPAPAAEPAEEVDLVAAFADFSLPARPAIAEGAVDISLITPRRETPPTPSRATPPPRPVHPSRHWVQVATGRNTGALEFDWRRIKREAGGLLDRPAPHVAAWGQTNRLVAGPFASAREADQLVAKLKEKRLDSFRFTSAQGEEVKPLS
jgi:tetratricopeptide (TPR) repeat protein